MLIVDHDSPDAALLRQSGVTVKTTGWFNVTNSDIITSEVVGSLNNSDPLMTTRIMYSNASFPQWTFSELALAEIGFETDLPGDVANLESQPRHRSFPSTFQPSGRS